MAKEIRITFKGGKATIAASGYSGDECKRATAGVEKALGAKTSDVDTDEMHVTSAQTRTVEY